MEFYGFWAIISPTFGGLGRHIGVVLYITGSLFGTLFMRVPYDIGDLLKRDPIHYTVELRVRDWFSVFHLSQLHPVASGPQPRSPEAPPQTGAYKGSSLN